MKPGGPSVFLLLFLSCQCFGQGTNSVTYTLLSGSYLQDDCLICGRPTIQQPLHGTFELVLVQDTPPFTRYTVQNVNFKTDPNSGQSYDVSGGGNYERFEELAMLQNMQLALQLENPNATNTAYFTNDSSQVLRPFPLIQIHLQQTNGTLVQTFSLELRAAPVREVWFSTSSAFTATNFFAPSNKLTAGDLLSSRGGVVRSNQQLVSRLGIMPLVGNLGLDAVNVTAHGEILFSISTTQMSETLGPLRPGDLLSDRGRVVKRNQDLLAAFQPASTNDAGLDGVQRVEGGEILFSVQTNVALKSGGTLSGGDILSDKGTVFRTHAQLMAQFRPADTNVDLGLRSFFLFGTGEIWFSVEKPFADNLLGPIQAGDVLSSFGYVAFRNQELLAPFGITDPSQDYGLDGLYVIGDLESGKRAPRFTAEYRNGNLLHLEWDGEGSVFQLERAASLPGAWMPWGNLAPDLSAEIGVDPPAAGQGFFRLRQW
jgi:hypothetical protein